jgi:hypothetical protein
MTVIGHLLNLRQSSALANPNFLHNAHFSTSVWSIGSNLVPALTNSINLALLVLLIMIAAAAAAAAHNNKSFKRIANLIYC